MDKYEFNLKIEQLRKLIDEEDYITALRIVQSIDWNRVRNTNLLTTAATVYEKNDMLQEAKDMIILAFERAPVGKHLLFKLTELSCRTGDLEEAEDYYHEFRSVDATDIGNYTLQYMILKARHAPYERQLLPLERYCEIDPDEKWLYELATVYENANRSADCVRVCDRLALLYGGSKYGLKALRLKSRYAELTDAQMNILYPRSVPAASGSEAFGSSADGAVSESAAANYAAVNSAQSNTYGSSSEYATTGTVYSEPQPEEANYAAASVRGYAASNIEPAGTGIYDDRDYRANNAQQTDNAGYYSETEALNGSQEMDARKSDALAAERFADEDAAFEEYVRKCASGEGRPAAAAVEVVNGTATVQELSQQAENDDVQMVLDFRNGEPTVVGEAPASEPAEQPYQQTQTPEQKAADSDLTAASAQPISAAAPFSTAAQQSTETSQAAYAAATPASAYSPSPAPTPAPAPAPVSAPSAAVYTNAGNTAAAAQSIAASAVNAAAQTAAFTATAASVSGAAGAVGGTAEAAGNIASSVFGNALQGTQARQPVPAAAAAAQTPQPQTPIQQAIQQPQPTQAQSFVQQDKPQGAMQAAASSQTQPSEQPAPRPAQRPLVPHQQLKSATPVKGLHMIVEALTDADGLSIAIDELKNIHEEKGIAHASIKTSAEKLNKNGISDAIIAKVSGKDFVIEHAGALSAENIQVLYNFICMDKTGTIVVLIDTPEGLDHIEELRPEFFDICDYISDVEDDGEQDYSEEPEVKVKNGVSSRQTQPSEDEEPYDDTDYAEDDDRPYEDDDEDAEALKNKKKNAASKQQPEERTPVKRSNGKAGAERFNNVREVAPENPEHQMEIDEFAQYCSQYAASIDCSITGKSMLALYERIELMEENDVPLTVATAEQLIEEAADRAEKPPIGKRLSGMFKSKYDKNGLLVLKEEDFIY